MYLIGIVMQESESARSGHFTALESLHRDDATASQEHAAHEPRSIPRTAGTPLRQSKATFTSPALALLQARHPGETVGILRHDVGFRGGKKPTGIIPVDKRRKAIRVSVELNTWKCPTCYEIYSGLVISAHLASCAKHPNFIKDPVWKARFRYAETPGLPATAAIDPATNRVTNRRTKRAEILNQDYGISRARPRRALGLNAPKVLLLRVERFADGESMRPKIRPNRWPMGLDLFLSAALNGWSSLESSCKKGNPPARDTSQR